MTKTVGPEGLTGTDLTLSYRHKLWGDDCPACDTDAMLTGCSLQAGLAWPAVEYAHGTACAEIEYKQQEWQNNKLSIATLEHPNVQAFIGREVTVTVEGQRHQIPIGVSIYNPVKDDQWEWYVPLKNGKALGNDRFRQTFQDWLSAEMPNMWQVVTINSGISAVKLTETEWVEYLYHVRSLIFPRIQVPSYVRTQILMGKTMPKRLRGRIRLADLEG